MLSTIVDYIHNCVFLIVLFMDPQLWIIQNPQFGIKSTIVDKNPQLLILYTIVDFHC